MFDSFPPAIRYLAENLIILALIPGPAKPRILHAYTSFLGEQLSKVYYQGVHLAMCGIVRLKVLFNIGDYPGEFFFVWRGYNATHDKVDVYSQDRVISMTRVPRASAVA
jgi:hypothetical protein